MIYSEITLCGGGSLERFMRGWNTSMAILTPSEVGVVLSDLHHVIFQSRVSADYVESDPRDFFDSYEKFYEKLACGYKFDWRSDWRYFNWHIGITNDTSKCEYGPPFQDKNDDQMYKINTFSEPCVGIGPFALYIPDDKKLYKNYSYTQFPQFTVGIKVAYPRLFVRDENEQMVEVFTETYKVYQMICERIKKISKGLVFVSNGKKYNANVKIGNDVRNDLKKFYFFTYYGCTEI